MFEKPTKKEAIQKLLAAIKLCKATFADEFPNFCEVLSEWELSLKQRFKILVQKSHDDS